MIVPYWVATFWFQFYTMDREALILVDSYFYLKLF